MSDLQELKLEVEKIKERNKRVEADKAWETSTFRRVSIAIVTYLLVSLLMYTIGVSDPFINAIVPAAGYLLSTLSLSLIKNWWLSRR